MIKTSLLNYLIISSAYISSIVVVFSAAATSGGPPSAAIHAVVGHTVAATFHSASAT